MNTKRCPTCGETDIEQFGKNRSKPDGLQNYCKPCRAEAKKSKETFVTYTRVTNGKTTLVTRRTTTHGLSKKEKLYKVWCGMKRRCNEPQAQNYRWYGGKGIKVCDDWQRDYLLFREWALAAGYADGLQLDRIDSDKNYEPDNCQWTTQKENIRRRDTFWSDELDQRLVNEAKKMGISPYEFIKLAVEAMLAGCGQEVIA